MPGLYQPPPTPTQPAGASRPPESAQERDQVLGKPDRQAGVFWGTGSDDWEPLVNFGIWTWQKRQTAELQAKKQVMDGNGFLMQESLY